MDEQQGWGEEEYTEMVPTTKTRPVYQRSQSGLFSGDVAGDVWKLNGTDKEIRVEVMPYPLSPSHVRSLMRGLAAWLEEIDKF